MNIKGKIVTLRAIEKEDLELMREMINDPEIENLVVGWAFPISKYQQNLWYEKNINDNKNLRFIIETPNDGAVGLATLVDIDWKNRRARHGIKLAKRDHRTKGIGTDTVMSIMRYAFDELQLNRLDGSWFEDNLASQKLYTKCGWKVEGKNRKCIYKNGKYRDLVIVGILSEEYYELIEINNYWDEQERD
ncbi:MAG TPA: GNAT family N-acetyltransferase [Gallicola sp.]|jgi:RimJ/RimL family protein N-acetyltransferase|nr:GNAT family N-acetyltransferase [Gallicola sp.]